jgi:hypothetical protein
MFPLRPIPRASLLLFFWLGLSSAAAAVPQDRPADAAEITRNLLYQPARRIDSANGALLFRAAEFTYRLDASGGWSVVREKNDVTAGLRSGPRWKEYSSTRLGATFRFTGVSTDNEAFLEIRLVGPDGPPADPVARIRLWDRKQLAAAWLDLARQDAASLTAAEFEHDLEIGDPDVAEVADDGASFWIAIRYSGGEGAYGIGSIVRFDPQTNGTILYQPEELAESAVTHIAATGSVIWLGAERIVEGGVQPTVRLARFRPDGKDLRSSLPGSGPIPGSIVTAIRAEAGVLWVATDEGICHSGSSEDAWTCWQIVPMVRVSAALQVSNRPGGTARRPLPAGSYEVRWANAAFIEVITPDALEGWIANDDLEGYVTERFQTDAFELGNELGGGATPMHLLDKPDGDPLTGALVYRAPLLPVSQSTPGGWQRVSANVGWLSRKNLEVLPVVRPAEAGTSNQ